MVQRRLRPTAELDERDLEGVPVIVLGAVISLFEHLEVYRPLTDEELSTMEVVARVRDGRNQLVEERFGRNSDHPALRGRRLPGQSSRQA